MKTRVLAPHVALLTCLAVAAPATAATTGNWTGETSQSGSGSGSAQDGTCSGRGTGE